ncbi:hypothetical protein MNBD_GAMMA11-3265, partial [hydrothermal vent metagenome]
NVFTNSRSNIHKGSGDKAAAGAPDVCKTPVGSAVVPIPYPNISQSSTLKKGSKSVKINGKPACLEKSTFDSSSGDQAGRLGGIISGVTGKETRFISSSFDVQIEGQNTVRHMDVTTHNHGNTMGAVYGSSTAPTTIKDEKTLCDYCKKPVHEFAKKRGTNNGDGQELRESIIADIADHRWYTGPNSLQAHHLICTEAMKGGDWGDITWEFGYSINHRNNGVILPYPMAVACQLHVPVHRSNHSKGTAGTLSYPDEIESYIKDILEDALAGEYCDNPQGLIDDMDEYSEFVLKQIDSFTWTITADGRDYKTGNNGCAGVSSITKKPNEPCPCNRVHGITRYEQQTLLIHDKKTLEIGT